MRQEMCGPDRPSVGKELIRSSPDTYCETEERLVVGDRCVVRWLYRFTPLGGKPQRLRGVDIVRVRDGKVAEKLAYVKG
jgi:hypothetical protein